MTSCSDASHLIVRIWTPPRYSAPRTLVIDRINGEEIKPLKLKSVSEVVEDDEAIINATVKIKTLVKNFQKGINTIEIAYGEVTAHLTLSGCGGQILVKVSE